MVVNQDGGTGFNSRVSMTYRCHSLICGRDRSQCLVRSGGRRPQYSLRCQPVELYTHYVYKNKVLCKERHVVLTCYYKIFYKSKYIKLKIYENTRGHPCIKHIICKFIGSFAEYNSKRLSCYEFP